MITIEASVSKGWLHKHGDFVFNNRYYMDPFYRMKLDEECHTFVKNMFPDYPIYNMESNLVQAEYVVPKMMLVGAIQPNMIIAAALGADFIFSPDKDSDVKGYPLQAIKSTDELPSIEEVLELPFIKRLENQYLKLSKTYPDYRVIPPFFWDTSGRATIHGIITTSMKFIGQDIFTSMVMEPELVKGIHQWITGVYIAVIKRFSALGNLPVTSVHVGECSGAMIDAYSYSEFVSPNISKLGAEFGNIRLHSCGFSDHILEAMYDVVNLAIIDTGSNTSLALIREKMGKDFEINVAPPVDVMAEGSSITNMKKWLKKTLDDNDGGNLKIVYHLEADYSWENCKYIHEELHNLGIVKKARLY